MFIKSNIRKVTIAMEKTLGNRAYIRLGQAGIIHLARTQSDEILNETAILAEEIRTRDIIMAGCTYTLNALKIEAGETFVLVKMRDLEGDSRFVSKAKKVIERIQRARARIQDEAAALAEQLEFAQALDSMGINPETLKKARLMKMVFGQVTDPIPEFPAERSFIIAASDRYLFGAALQSEAEGMLRLLKEHGFVDKTDDISGRSLADLKKREAILKHRLETIEIYTDRIRKEMGPTLLRLHHTYREYEEILKAMRLSGFSEKAMFITGWIDARDKNRLIKILKDICEDKFILIDEPDPDAPVRLRNMRLFKPFELIVSTMGMPANSEIDPTPLAALTFVIIFGLMFGDLGQGLVLAAAGLILKLIGRRKSKEFFIHAGSILLACGLSAAICGVLYGSLFSSEHLIPALWLRPMENIMTLFAITILIGTVIIFVGLSLNIINALINHDYVEAFLEKKGLAILIFYSSLVIMSIRYAVHKQVPALWEIGIFVFAPILVFSLRGVIGPALFNGKRPHETVEYITETVMDIVEIVLSMFANTVSFIRVGAFALSHAGLSIATFTLAGIFDPGLKSIMAISILVIGNIIIIVFEGMICGIQSMRLEYYEFFSKFFRGDGISFSPFILKSKFSEV
jgi:V/A-type H+/Na+-transporting ATPase subunit I